MRVVDSKIKGKPLTESVGDWQKGEEEYTKDYIETLVTFAYRNYPVMTKLEIANLQLRKCLKAEGLVERIWLPDTNDRSGWQSKHETVIFKILP